MDNVKIILENGIENLVNGIFYIFNSKYYFIYTQGEFVDSEYVQLYVAQVCKEVQNTPTGPVDTGFMLGIEIKDPNEWSQVQGSITKIVDDKKNNTTSTEIQYLPMNMLTNLKIVTKNKFKLLKNIVEENFKVVLSQTPVSDAETSNKIEPTPISELQNNQNEVSPDVIIDYRTKFFEEQEKNKELQNQIKKLEEKLNSIKGILQ